MMEDNIRYTAMRIFQEIEGADVLYINTYAATTPRLQVFKKICSTNSKELELIEPASIGIWAQGPFKWIDQN